MEFITAPLRSLLATLIVLFCAPLTRATNSNLDSAFVTTISPGVTPESYPTFDTGTGAVNAVTLQSDGKIIIGGNISRYKAPPAGTLQTSLKRLNADGSLDTTFDVFAATLVDSQGQTEINKLLTVAGDKVYVGGGFTSYQGTARSGILRLNADGTLDTAFNASGISNSNSFGVRVVLAIAEQPDGKVLVGGGFNRANGTFRPNLARFNADGSLDTTFNPNAALGTSGSVGDIEILPDGKILVGTNLSIGNFTHKPALLRLNPDGSLDSSFQVPFLNQSGTVQQVLPLPDGRIVISGFLALPGYESNLAAGFIAAVHSDGSLDATFIANLGTGPNGWVGGELQLQPDGTILAGGIFNFWNGQPRASIARLQPDGTLDSALAVPPYELNRNQYLTHFYDFAIQPDGKIVVGGWFSRVSDPVLETYNVTRILNEFSPTSPGTLRLLSTAATATENAGSINLQVSRFGGLVGTVSVQFTTANGTATAGADYTSASGTLSWAAGEGGVKTITVPILPDAAAEPSETFTVTLSGATGGATIAPDRTQTIVTLRDDDSAPVITRDPASVSLEQGARFTLSVRYDSVLPATVQWQRDPDGAGPLPFADILFATGIDYTVSLATPESHAGDYRAIVTNQPNGSPATTTTAVATVSVSVPAGSVIADFAPFLSANVTDYSVDASGRILLTTGNREILRFLADGTPDTSFAVATFDGTVTSVLALPDGKIVVGGFFNTVNGTAKPDLARLNADGTLDAAYAPALPAAAGSGGNLSVASISPAANGKYYVGFGSGGGLARYLADGTLDSSFTPPGSIGSGRQGAVYAVRELPNGQLYVAYQSGSNGFAFSYGLVRLNDNGTQDTTFVSPTLNWYVTGIDVLPDGRIAIAGRFSSVNGVAAQRLAVLFSDGSLDPSFDFSAGANAPVYGVAYRDGRLLAWGEFTTVAGAAPRGLVRLNLDGSVDPNFSIGAGANGAVSTAFYTPTGDIFIGGSFTSIKGVSRNYAALLVGNAHIGAIGFDSPRATALESASPLTLTLRRYGPTTEAVSIDYATGDFAGPGAATADEDYLSTAGTVTWAAGDSADKTIQLTLVSDGLVEPTESFRVLLSNPSGPVTAAANAVVTLLDADTPVTFTAQPSSPASLLTGDAFALSATTTSPSPTTYQWFLNGVAIPDATTPALSRPSVTLADAGLYTLVATNAAGSFTSAAAHVVIAPRSGTLLPGQASAGRPSFNSAPLAVLALPDGGALVGGQFTNVNSSGISYLVRVHADGSLDTSFNLNLNGPVAKLLFQPDGKILVGGSFGSIGGLTHYSLARLHADLTHDTAFAANVGTLFFRSTSTVNNVGALALDSTGRIYAGQSEISGALYRFATDGTRDTGYTVAVNQSVRHLAMQADDKLIVAGFFSSLAGSSASRIGRLNTDGTRDTSFTMSGLSGTSTYNDVKFLADGRLIVAGSLGSLAMAQLSDTGSVVSNLGSSSQIYQIDQGPTGKIVVVRTGASPVYRLKGTNPFPSPGSNDFDPTFQIGTGPGGEVRAVDHAADGSIWLAGQGGVIRLFGDPADPSIVNPPANATALPGATARFAVGAVGTGLSYQWFKGEVPLADDARISGATTAILTITDAALADEADYSVAVTRPGTPDVTVLGGPVRFYLLGAPVVATELAAPASRLFVGENLSLSAEVFAAAPATYVWRRGATVLANDARISGADTAALTLTGALESDTGDYTLTITNAQGTATTVPAFVLVAPRPDSRAPTHLNLAANRIVGSFLPLPDGRMLIGSSASTAFTGGTGPNVNNSAFVLVNPDGSLSPVGSPVTNHNTTNSPVSVMVRQPDGKFIVGGAFTSMGPLSRNRIARLNADFSADTTFDPGAGAPNGVVNALAIDASGRIYVGGSFTSFGGVNLVVNGPARSHLVRLLPDGTFDDTFRTWLNGPVEKLIALPSGGLLVGGSFTAIPSLTPPIPASYLIRLDADGVPIPTFVPNVGNTVADLALSPAGDRIYAALNSSPYLRRFHLDGTQDTAFTPTSFGQNSVRRIAVQSDGKVIATGNFTGTGFTAPIQIVRLLSDGSPDPTFTLGNTNLTVGNNTNALAVDPAGRIWLGGTFSATVQGTSATRLLVLSGDLPELAFDLQPVARSVDLGGSTTFTATVRSTGPVTWQWFKDGAPLSDDARISGSTTSALTITGLLRTDSAAYTVTATRVDDSVPPVTTVPANLAVLAEPVITVALTGAELEAGVPFSFAASARGAGTLSYQWIRGDGEELAGQTTATLNLPAPTTSDTGWYRLRVTNSLGTVTSAPALLRFSQLAGGLAGGLTLPSFTNSILKVVTPLPDDAFLVAGSFTRHTPPGGFSTTTSGFLAMTAAGSRDTSYAYINNSGSPVEAMVRDSQGRIVIAGNFNTLFFGGNITRYVVARLAANGSVDTGWNSPFGNVSNQIAALAIDASDRVLVGGSFNSIGSPAVPNTARLARLDATTGAVDATFVSATLPGSVNALSVLADGRILVGTTSGVRLLEANGSLAAGFTSGTFNNILTIHPLPGGDFLLGTTNGLQRINATGTLISPFPATGTGTNGFSAVRTILPLASGGFLIGGDFTTYNNVTANRIVAINADGTAAPGFVFGDGFNNSVYSLAFDASGRIWAGGSFTAYRGATANRIAVLNTTDFIPDAPPPPAEETDPFDSFLADAGVPEGQRAPTDDPDGDGLPNLLEYALGLDPLLPNDTDTPFSFVIDGDLTLSYLRAQPDSVTYVVETTTDLTDPDSWTSVGVNQGTPGPDQLTTASVLIDGPRRFLRLRVTLVAP